MAKPIFLVGLPHRDEGYVNDIVEGLNLKLTDYHTIVYMHHKDDTEFRVFYEKDFDEVKFEELKEIVRSLMSS